MQITFLGTSAGMPTRNRNVSSVHFKFRANNFLFDCGEGTQRQMISHSISIFKINAIFITHLHADHMLGVAGMIQSMNMLNRTEPLTIYGPKGIEKYVEFFKNWDALQLNYEVKTQTITEGIIFENNDLVVRAFPVDHSCTCFAFNVTEKVDLNLNKAKIKKAGLENNPLCRTLKEKGQVIFNGKTIKLREVADPLRKPLKFSYVVDTTPIPSIINNVNGSDILVCEATFSEREREKAIQTKHMTSKDAATIALKAKVNHLILTHFSPRYEDNTNSLREEARRIFKNTDIADDFYTVEV